MNWPEDLDAEPLAAIYVVANTPRYLFKHLRREEVVQQLAKTARTDDLGNLVSRLVSKRERSELDIARAYAALAAMSLRPYDEWRNGIEGIDLTKLDWGEKFRTLMKGTAKAVVITDVRAPQTKVGPHVQPVSTTASRISASVPRIVVVEG